MMIRSKLLVVLLAFLVVSPGMVAQKAVEQTTTAAVVPEDQQATPQQLERLFEVMRIKEQMAATIKMMPQIMQQQFAKQMEQLKQDHPELSKLSPEQQAASEKVMAKFFQNATGLYSADEMVADLKTIYQRHLTGSDVENLITFYNSPTGQHMLDMVPAIMQEYLPMMMDKMQTKLRPLILEMSKEIVEITVSPAGKSEGKSADQPK